MLLFYSHVYSHVTFKVKLLLSNLSTLCVNVFRRKLTISTFNLLNDKIDLDIISGLNNSFNYVKRK